MSVRAGWVVRGFVAAASYAKPVNARVIRFSTDNNAQNEKKEVDFYKVLGLPKSADPQRIKQAYLKKAALWHPDRNSHTPDLAKRKFEEVSEAMAVLSDEETRRMYDNGLYKRGTHVKKQPPRAGY